VEIGKIYGIVLVLGMVGVLLGVLLTVLGKLADNAGLSTAAKASTNKVIDVIYDIPNSWIPILVVIGVAGIVLFAVTRFGGSGGGKR
jgi:heme/copper-type cytochrome/quinol oxidase subunit 2